MLNRFKTYLESLGLSYKKECLIISMINLSSLIILLLLLYFTKNIVISLSSFALLLLGNALNFFRYSNIKRRISDSYEDEFIVIISYFQTFIHNGFNVYQSFNNILPYASEWMKEKIDSLLIQIDNDKTVKPFVAFAHHFHNSIAENVMLSIYQMIDEGESGAHMLQFNILFENLSSSHQKELIDRKDKSLSSLSTYPLIGAGLITIIITFSVILIMGDMINVI